MRYPSVNRFRTRRGRILRAQIEALADRLGRDVVVLDIGGRPDYWANVGLGRVARIDLLNLDPSEIALFSYPGEIRPDFFRNRVGDARDLSDFPDQSVDLVHSNSVIEHVGDWGAMREMAREMRRVGRAGWMQTPAWEFPVEPHFRQLFGHWLGKPAQARLLSLSFAPQYRVLDRERRRAAVERINLLSKGEVRALFPDTELFVERLILAKSYVARWMPAAGAVSAAVSGDGVAAGDGARDGESPPERAVAADAPAARAPSGPGREAA